jgi:Ca-activated chloride channel family protein
MPSCRLHIVRWVHVMRLRLSLAFAIVHLAWSFQDSIPDSGFRISTDVNVVMIDIGVKNAGNRFVGGLTRENFHVFDNGRDEPIRYFGKSDLPVTLGLVIDNSGSMYAKRAMVIQSATELIRASNTNDQVFTVEFNDAVTFGLPATVPFTDNIPELIQALSRGRARGRTALYDGLTAATKHLGKSTNGRKAIVLVSDGGDNSSKSTWQSAKSQVERSGAAIYTIGIFDQTDPDRNPAILRQLADMSGGEYFYVPDILALPGVCETIATDIRNTYTVAYKAPDDRQLALHRLKVKVTAPGNGHLTVRARNSYFPRAAMPVAERLK